VEGKENKKGNLGGKCLNCVRKEDEVGKGKGTDLLPPAFGNGESGFVGGGT